MKTLIWLSLTVLLLTTGSCKKDAPEAALPSATQEGKNTGGCLINGKPFVATPSGYSLLSNPSPAFLGGFQADGSFSIRLRGTSERGLTYLYLTLARQSEGTYILGPKTLDSDGKLLTDGYAVCEFADARAQYETDAQHLGKVVLTHVDKAQGIAAGTFEFDAANTAAAGAVVRITSGRFDRKQ